MVKLLVWMIVPFVWLVMTATGGAVVGNVMNQAVPFSAGTPTAR